MVGNSQVGDSTKVVRLFFLNAHLEYLSLCCRVNEPVTDLVHSRDWEEWSDASVLSLQELVPL